MQHQPSILILEDEFLVALDLADQLEVAGFRVSGPFTTASDALSSIDQSPPAAAVLDVNLGGDKTSEPVALALQEQSIPFVFLTGYSEQKPLFEQVIDAPFLTKPSSPDTLIREIRNLVGLDGTSVARISR